MSFFQSPFFDVLPNDSSTKKAKSTKSKKFQKPSTAEPIVEPQITTPIRTTKTSTAIVGTECEVNMSPSRVRTIRRIQGKVADLDRDLEEYRMSTDTALNELSEDLSRSNENSEELRDGLVRLDKSQKARLSQTESRVDHLLETIQSLSGSVSKLQKHYDVL